MSGSSGAGVGASMSAQKFTYACFLLYDGFGRMRGGEGDEEREVEGKRGELEGSYF